MPEPLKQFIDSRKARKLQTTDRLYRVAARIALKYGKAGDRCRAYPEHAIREFWDYDDQLPPCYENFRRTIKVKTTKWYLYNCTTYDDGIWNADFLHGLTSHGKLSMNKEEFPSFRMENHNNLIDVIKTSPFGGDMNLDFKHNQHVWSCVPALNLRYSEDSVSYVAGIMAGAQLMEVDKNNYAMFSKRFIPVMEKLGIPIEFKKLSRGRIFISPFWPALFSLKMPKPIGDIWLNVKHPCNAQLYASILCKVYLDSMFGVGRIPYLKTRRSIFYEFKCEEGAVGKLKKLWVEKGLTVLDNRIKEMIKLWDNLYNKKKEQFNEVPAN